MMARARESSSPDGEEGAEPPDPPPPAAGGSGDVERGKARKVYELDVWSEPESQRDELERDETKAVAVKRDARPNFLGLEKEEDADVELLR